MAKSQMLTSKNPRAAAGVFHPRAMKMVRMVASVTTHVSAKKTKTGKERIMEKIDPTGRGTSLLLDNFAAALKGASLPVLKEMSYTALLDCMQAEVRSHIWHRLI